MRVEPMEDGSVRIILSRADMDANRLRCDALCGEKTEARRQLSRLLHLCRAELPFDPLSGKLYAEVFPYADGGCMLFLRLAAGQQAGFDTPLVVGLTDRADLTALARLLHRRYHHVILQSTLYWYEGQYLLLLYTYCRMETALLRAAGEYGRLWGKGALAAAEVTEQGRCLLAADALRQLTSG